MDQDQNIVQGSSVPRKHWWLWVAIAITVVVVFAAFKIANNKNNNKSASDNNQQSSQAGGTVTASKSVAEGCVPTQLTASPISADDFVYFMPMGMVIGSHVTPIDHGYFYPKNWSSKTAEVDVHAPGDGTITDIMFEDQSGDPTGPQNFANAVSIEYACGIHSTYLLMTKLSPDILAATGGKYPVQGKFKIPVKAGQVIGKVAGRSLDFAMLDDHSTLTGFVNPASYDGESWKIHTIDPFKYFTADVKSIITAKDPRKVEPIGGKIDFDIDGKLVGSWFQSGTGGYTPPNHAGDYWKGHLSFIYDQIDPTAIRISMGNYNNEAKQFGVKGNAPDPAKIGAADGLVKYELVSYDNVNAQTGSRWTGLQYEDIKVKNNTNIEGVVLVQLTENRKLKFEAFPGKTAAQVSGFDSNAVTYER